MTPDILLVLLIRLTTMVLLMMSIALNTAAQLPLSAEALMMGVALASSSSFTSPVSHPANVLVMDRAAIVSPTI